MTVKELKPLEDQVVFLRLTDGEELRATIRFVDAEYGDIIVDVIESNQPEHYKHLHAAYALPAAMIVSAEKWDDSK